MEPASRHKYIRYSEYYAAAVIFAFVLTGCGSKDKSSEDDDYDAALRRPDAEREKWSIEEVASGGVGDYTKLALAKDGPVVAYFANKSRTGDPCADDGSTTGTKKEFWDLYFSQKSGGKWQQERVTPLLAVGGNLPGLDMKIAPNGSPVITTLTGEPINTATQHYCGANDLGYFTRTGASNWQPEIVVRDSGEAAVTGDTAEFSNHGNIVGFWPALAFDKSGNAAIAYQDLHTQSLERFSKKNADLELALGSSGNWRAVAIDWGRGAGKYNRIAFDKQNRPVVLYYLEEEENVADSQQGLWAARSSDNGATWQKVRLFAGPVPELPDIAVDRSSGSLYVVYYNKNTRIIYLATLNEDTAFESASKGWTFESFGDSQYDEGKYSSIAVDPDGRIGVAYYRCAKATGSGDECPPSENALVFAWREIGRDGAWTVEKVDGDDQSRDCGTYASLAFAGDGTVYIAYKCRRSVNGELESRVYMAKREPL